MKKNADLLVFCPVNPLRADSGVKYLCEALTDAGVQVELWAVVPWQMRHEFESWTCPVHVGWWYAILPRTLYRVQMLLARLHIFLIGLFSIAPILYIETGYVREIAALKKLRPKRLFIQYCPELFTEQDPIYGMLKSAVRYYAKVADLPDMIIDVEPTRAQIRKQWYRLSKDPFVIPNTLPLKEMPTPAPKGSLARLANCTFPVDRPILLYAGAVHRDREMGLLVDALKQMSKRPFLVAFCYGDDSDIEFLRQRCRQELGDNEAQICNAVARINLLACLHEADAGFMYYRPSIGIGYLHAAPTKLYEYIAAGMPVITSNNPGIVELVSTEGFGVSVQEDTAASLAQAIDKLLNQQYTLLDEIRIRERRKFNTELCYEIAAAPVIEHLVTLIGRNR